MADNKLVGIEVATRLLARAVSDLSEDVGDAEIAAGRVEEAVGRMDKRIEDLAKGQAELRAEIAASRAATEQAVSLTKELEGRSLPGRIVGWAGANPLLTVAIIGMLLLFQSGYAYLIPSLLGAATHDTPHDPPTGPVDAAPPPSLPAGSE